MIPCMEGSAEKRIHALQCTLVKDASHGIFCDLVPLLYSVFWFGLVCGHFNLFAFIGFCTVRNVFQQST